MKEVNGPDNQKANKSRKLPIWSQVKDVAKGIGKGIVIGALVVLQLAILPVTLIGCGISLGVGAIAKKVSKPDNENDIHQQMLGACLVCAAPLKGIMKIIGWE